MSNKKIKGTHGKPAPRDSAPAKAQAKASTSSAEKPRVPERIREKEPGFGVIKILAGVVVALIVGGAILGNLYGNKSADRGALAQDDPCASTQECRPGFVCLAYGGDRERCLAQCEAKNEESCEPGYKCVSSTRASGRKKIRLSAVCVPDAKAAD